MIFEVKTVDTNQFEPRNDAVSVIHVFARQAADVLVQLEIFHAYIALQTRICTKPTDVFRICAFFYYC